MTDTASDIIAALDACGARIELLQDGRLMLHTGSQPVPTELLAQLRAAKVELIEFLTLNPPPQKELLLPDPEVASSFHEDPPDFAEHKERNNTTEDSASCTSRSSYAPGLASSSAPYEVLADAPAGERCTLCGSGRDVRRIRYGGEMRLWHVACADHHLDTIAKTSPPKKDKSEPPHQPPPAPPLHETPPAPSDDAPTAAQLSPIRCGDGRLLWRFPVTQPTDVNPTVLMVRARNHGAVLTRDGMILIISSWSRLQPELVAALQRHSGTILQRLSRESATRIAHFQRGESGLVTEVLVFDPKPRGGE